MRIVVFSDSHKNFRPLREIVEAQPGAEIFLHLGDGEQEFVDLQHLYPEKMMRGVAGNCDWGSTGKFVDQITCEGKKVFFTHGHHYGVKGGLDSFVRAARTAGAKIALYGHTHRAETHYEDGVYIMNPGSVSHPKEGGPSYGIIDITPQGIFTKIIELDEGKPGL